MVHLTLAKTIISQTKINDLMTALHDVLCNSKSKYYASNVKKDWLKIQH